MRTERHPLYFIAVLPPEEIQAEITAFKERIAGTWGTRHALRSPPHITLFPPFSWPDRQLPALIKSLGSFAKGLTAFYVELKNFEAFPPGVIFVNPLKNKQLELLFQKLARHLELNFHCTDARNARPFHPHMTIAHRDLPEDSFPAIWTAFRDKSYERIFRVNAIVLLKQENGRWEPLQTFPF